MVCRIPKEIQEELCECGGLDGLMASMPSRALIKATAARHATLSKPERLMILAMLRNGDRCVCVIKAIVGTSDSKLSYHLSCLRRAGLVRSRRVRSYIYYSLTEEGRRTADDIARNSR